MRTRYGNKHGSGEMWKPDEIELIKDIVQLTEIWKQIIEREKELQQEKLEIKNEIENKKKELIAKGRTVLGIKWHQQFYKSLESVE